MNIRPATIADLDRCERIDGSYITDYVWQVDESIAADRVSILLQRTRIPRRMAVSYPRAPHDLQKDWQRGECFWVADELATIFGYIDLTVCPWQGQGWIEHLVVHPPYRRRGIATLLLQVAERWALDAKLRAVTVVMQTKNDPAVTLFSKRGYAFVGCIDRYYESGDIALLYALNLSGR